jgi:hypothetical protein
MFTGVCLAMVEDLSDIHEFIDPSAGEMHNVWEPSRLGKL